MGKSASFGAILQAFFFGLVAAIENNGDGRLRVDLENCRRIWEWYGGLSIQDVAINGVITVKSRLSATVDWQTVADALEVVSCSASAISILESAPAESAGQK